MSPPHPTTLMVNFSYLMLLVRGYQANGAATRYAGCGASQSHVKGSVAAPESQTVIVDIKTAPETVWLLPFQNV